jgi:hypothetical protein
VVCGCVSNGSYLSEVQDEIFMSEMIRYLRFTAKYCERKGSSGNVDVTSVTKRLRLLKQYSRHMGVH